MGRRGISLNIFLDGCEGHIMTKRMLPYWKRMGHNCYLYPPGCHIQLSFVRHNTIIKIPRILRIDGIYYDADTDWKNRNKEIEYSALKSNGIIFQSNYSKLLCETLFVNKIPSNIQKTVIYNGIEANWCGKPREHDGINITVWGKFRRHKRLKEIIDLFIIYNKIVPDSHLHVFGDIHNNIPVRHNNIHFYGMVSRESMYGTLVKTDMTLHLSKRDSCPNSVVEAIGAGIPVITTDKCGGATEVCSITDGCIVCSGDFDSMEPDYPYRDSFNVITPELRDNIINAMVAITNDKRRVSIPDAINIENVAKSYIKFMKDVLK